jgi:hypothetical protein
MKTPVAVAAALILSVCGVAGVWLPPLQSVGVQFSPIAMSSGRPEGQDLGGSFEGPAGANVRDPVARSDPDHWGDVGDERLRATTLGCRRAPKIERQMAHEV